MVALKSLRSFTGKAQSIASLLYTWRPFVQMLYAAIYSEAPAGRPHLRWVEQISIPVQWIIAFLSKTEGSLHREFTLASYLRLGDKVFITTDASPYGIGAVLQVNNVIVSYIADDITADDRRILQLQDDPSCEDQQLLEALTALVALREWCEHWKKCRVVLAVQGDNMATLTLITKMQPHSARLALVAREMALDICSAIYSPDIVGHVPGVSNVTADALSRLKAPTEPKPLPAHLRDVARHYCQPRPQSWWRSLPPSAKAR